MPRITKTGNSVPYLPGATVSWDITVTNTTEASTSLDEFVIDDLVPDQYDDGTPITIDLRRRFGQRGRGSGTAHRIR